MIAFTGERLGSQDESFRLDRSQHLAAYLACLPYAAEKVVLDGGCGEGYGTNCIAGSARVVVGVDRSRDAVAHAGEEASDGALFACGDLLELGFGDESFDVVCSFQVLEHFRDPNAFLREAHRVLRPAGLLILTTPNELTSFSENPYHVKEYRPEELRELLSPIFASVEIQGVFGNDRVRALQRSRRRHVHGILKLDPFRVRRVLPPSVQKWAFAKLATFVRGRIRAEHRESFERIEPSDFAIRGQRVEESLDLLAICTK